MRSSQYDRAAVARELAPLLVDLCRRDAAGRVSEAGLEALADGARRERFLGFASGHGVVGLALGTLARIQSREAWPDELFRDRLHGCRRRAAALELGRDRVLAVLRAAELHPVVLKGAGLATTVYREPAERDLGDIDLLLARDEIDRAILALGRHGFQVPGDEAVEAGYREHHFHVRVQRPDGLIVELHWELTRRTEPFHLDASAFLAESVAAPGKPRIRVPRPELALLHIVAENLRDGLDRLTRLVDVDRIVAAAPAMDWDYLERTARASRLTPALALALELGHDLLGTPVPDEVRRRIRPSAAVRVHLSLLRPGPSLLRQRAVTRPSWVVLLQLWLLSGESRTVALVRILRGADADPLDWLWRGEGSSDTPSTGRAHPVRRLGKLVIYQLGLYARGLGGLPSSWSGCS